MVFAALMVTAAACSSGELSVTEYVEQVNAIVDRASQRYEAVASDGRGAVLVARRAQLADFTPQDLSEAFQEVRELEAELEEAIGGIDPPAQIADLHYLMFDFDDGFFAAQDAMAARARVTTSWSELSASHEMEAYRAALVRDKTECEDTEAELNAIAARREALADTPWIPGELKGIFEAVLGCTGYPEHPEDVYRPLDSPAP
jgi:hypothetical protein